MEAVATDGAVRAFLDRVTPGGRQADGRTLAALMARVTGQPATMWGPSIVGFGRYRYRYDSGREGTSLRVGFSPRKAALTLYLAIDGADPALLTGLGPHTTGKGCLYLKSLTGVDPPALAALVTDAWARSLATHPNG